MDFLAFAQSHGIEPGRLEQGSIVRCATKDHARKKNGAYLFCGDWGWVQDWSSHMEPIYWKDDSITTPEQIADLRARMEADRVIRVAERNRDANSAAQKAKAIIQKARMEQHAYLDSKGFREAVGLVWYPDEETNLLVIPMAIGREVVGCQMIDREGHKKFLKGQRTIGAEFVIGQVGTDVWCEGYATALSIHACLAAMKIPARIHACFSAGNLQRMAKAGLVIADNDASGTGEAAANATGLDYWMPPETGWDFNDWHVSRGTFAAGMGLKQFLTKRARG